MTNQSFNSSGTNVNMSDSLGNFLFNCNAWRLYDKNFNQMPNGDSLTLDYSYSDTEAGNHFTPLFFAVPWPDEKDNYLLFQTKLGWETFPTGVILGWGRELLFSKINMKLNNGLGDVVIKNELITQGSHFATVAACKHANGRDWWFIALDGYLREYVVMLFTPKGIERVEHIAFPPEVTMPFDPIPTPPIPLNWYPNFKLMFSSFNNQGSKFLFSNEHSGIYVFDFDRCTGQLGNYLRLEQPWWAATEWAIFSPNGRFIYSLGDSLQGFGRPVLNKYYQFDLEAADVQGSMEVVAENDDYVHPIMSGQHTVNFMMNAPDGKMYSASYQDFYHTIHFPNRKGKESRFRIRDVEFPSLSIPRQKFYYPNYRLGPIDNSSCDTLGLDNHPLAHFRWDLEDTLSPLALTFTDLSSYEPATWSWDFGDPASGASNMSSDTSPVHTFSAEGIYEVCLTVCNVNSCDTICKTVVLGEIQQFQANFGFVITNSNEVTFQDQSQTNPISWSWNFGDGATSAEQHPTHIYAQAGTYTACLVACNALGICDTFCLDVVVETVGLDENTSKVEENLYTIFPNPVQQEVYIFPKHRQNTSNVIFSLYDITGRAVFSEKLSKNQVFWKINLGGLVEGLYFYEIKNESGVVLQSGKVVKQGQ